MENSLINDIFKIYHLDEEGNIKNIFIFTGEIPIIHDEKGWFLEKDKTPIFTPEEFQEIIRAAAEIGDLKSAYMQVPA